jgi:hypothetical protein
VMQTRSKRSADLAMQFGEFILNHCHSEPILSARNLLVPAEQQIPRAILPRFGMTTWNKLSYRTTSAPCVVFCRRR